MKLNIAELDCFLLTFDEPNKEQHWAMLQETAPWSKRVDGVKGFDNAHKACAMQSDTEYLITIDGDNQIHPAFFDLVIDVPIQYSTCVLSWNSKNIVNGLIYGNGGVKIWPKEFILNMRSHENAVEATHAVDFCWDQKYIQLHNAYSTTFPNASALQAFRAGFREGCKMTLDRGVPVENSEQLLGLVHNLNARRLQAWGSIGADVQNGKWAILGTRVGTHYTNVLKENITLVREYDQFAAYAEPWLKTSVGMFDEVLARLSAEVYEATGLHFYDFSADQSKFIKQLQPQHIQLKNPLSTEMEVLSGV